MSNIKSIITSVVAHIDHGKTTLIDSLVAYQGKISKSIAGEIRYMDTREDEQNRGITLKLSAIGLCYKNTEHIIVDTPGHVDFEFLVENSSIISDCFLIIIDIMEGITPRTYSLINYIRKDCAILVINKVDKVETADEALDKIEKIIMHTNSMVGSLIFTWTNNNIILSSATYCYGINYNNANLLLKRDNTTLDNVVNFIFYIENQIKKNSTDKICSRFNILKRTRKNILSTVMPLANSIFECIEHIYKPETYKKYLYNSTVPLLLLDKVHDKSAFCFVSLGLLRNNLSFDKKNLMFVTRLFKGKIKTGDILYNNEEKYEIKSIYKFGINDFLEVDSVSGSTLVCLKGNFRKNMPIFSIKPFNYSYHEKIYPFYRSRLIPEQRDNIEEIKTVLRALVNTEQCLKIKINKYNQIDVLSSGKVQVEKLIEDLKKCNFKVRQGVDENLFCEFPKNESMYEFESEEYKIIVQIYKNDDSEYNGYLDEFNNRFMVLTDKFRNLIYSILEVYVISGPVISEYIRDTTFKIKFYEKKLDLYEEKLYSQIKQNIKLAYNNAEPSIAPFFYKLNISIQEECLGGVYTSIQKISSILQNEEYDEATGFYVLIVLVPYFVYDNFVEDVRVCTKGTAYILSAEFGYFYGLDFSDCIEEIRKKKGLMTNEKIIKNPEKQRTLKK